MFFFLCDTIDVLRVYYKNRFFFFLNRLCEMVIIQVAAITCVNKLWSLISFKSYFNEFRPSESNRSDEFRSSAIRFALLVSSLCLSIVY